MNASWHTPIASAARDGANMLRFCVAWCVYRRIIARSKLGIYIKIDSEMLLSGTYALVCLCWPSSRKYDVCVLGPFVPCAFSIEVESRNGLHDTCP